MRGIGPGQLATSNAEQVTRVRQIVEGLGLQIATPDEARALAEALRLAADLAERIDR